MKIITLLVAITITLLSLTPVAANETAEEMKSDLSKAWSDVKQGSVETWDNAKSGSGKLWEGTKDTAAEAADKGEEGASSLWNSIKSVFE